MNPGWLDRGVVRAFCLALVSVQILIAGVNLLYIPTEERELEAWQSHIESPEGGEPTAPAAPSSASHLNPKRELMRFVKQQLDLDRECNFTTWMASIQLGWIAFATLMLAAQSRRRAWLLLMAGFTYLSMDELCQVHEWVGTQLSAIGFHLGHLGPPYPWVIAFGPVFLIYAIGALRFLLAELASDRGLALCVGAGMLLMAASLPLEVIGGEIQGDAPRPPRLEVIAEETCETLGGTLILYAFLSLLIRRSTRIEERATP